MIIDGYAQISQVGAKTYYTTGSENVLVKPRNPETSWIVVSLDVYRHQAFDKTIADLKEAFGELEFFVKA